MAEGVRGKQLSECSSTEEYLQIEADSGAREPFRDLDEVLSIIFRASLQGQQAVKAKRRKRSNYQPRLYFPHLNEPQAQLIEQTMSHEAQESRGQWSLPEGGNIKAGMMNLGFHLTQDESAVMSLAAGERWRIDMGSETRAKSSEYGHPNAICIWTSQGFFERLAAPLTMRSEQRDRVAGLKKYDQQAKGFEAVVSFYEAMGLPTGPLEPFAPGSGMAGWSKQQVIDARRALIESWVQGADEAAARWRAISVGELVERYYKRAKKGGSPTRKQVMKKALEPVLSLWFGGDWLAFVDYLGEQAAPQEEIITEVEATEVVGGPAPKAAAADGLPTEEVERILSSYWGQQGGNPATLRAQVIEHVWRRLTDVYGELNAGDEDPPGLSSHVVEAMSGQQWFNPSHPGPLEPVALDSLLGDELAAQVTALWGSECPTRYTGRLITNTKPLWEVARLVGFPWDIWQAIGAAVHAQFQGEYVDIPVLRSALSGKYGPDYEALKKSGMGIDDQFFELADKLLRNLSGNREPRGLLIAIRSSMGPGPQVDDELKDGDLVVFSQEDYERFRQLVAWGRGQWMVQHLANWLEIRWSEMTRAAGDDYHRQVARRGGKEPTNSQLLSLGRQTANAWFGGQLDGLCAALQVPSPGPSSYQRWVPQDVVSFESNLYQALGGRVYPDRYWEMDGYEKVTKRDDDFAGLARAAVGYLQKGEMTGEIPTRDKSFEYHSSSISRDGDKAWRIYWEKMAEQGALIPRESFAG